MTGTTISSWLTAATPVARTLAGLGVFGVACWVATVQWERAQARRRARARARWRATQDRARVVNVREFPMQDRPTVDDARTVSCGGLPDSQETP